MNNIISYGDEVEKIHFEPIIERIIESFKSIGVNVKKLWLDVGSCVYDLHLEIVNSESNEHEDLYFEINENNLIGAYSSNGINLAKSIGEAPVSLLIEAILKTQSSRGFKTSTT